VVLVTLLGGWFLTQLVIRPLREVERATSRVTAGDLNQRVSTEGPREIAALATAFNRMTASVKTQREQLIRSEKLASVGQLAAGVAHEIGNPLAAILGYVDILRGDIARTDSTALSDEERRDSLDRVKSETQRIHRTIQDLLEYSRPAPDEARPVDVLNVIGSVEALLRPQARFRNVRVVIDSSSPWPAAFVSPERLAQVFVNVFINAADAMGQEGCIGVSVVPSAGDRTIRVCVADDGPGVPPDIHHKIFDPFFTTKEPGRGTGLGLPICRSILETAGGAIELGETPPGEKGARLLITLVAADPGGQRS